MGRSPERSYFRNAAHLLELPEQICISGPPSCCVQHHRLANTRLQVLFKTPDAWRVPLSHRLPRRHCSQVALIMDKVASSQMKHLSFFCDHNHQPGWNSDGRLRKLGAQCWLIGLRSSAQFYTAGHQQRRSGSYEPAKKSSPACRRALFHEPALQATPESQEVLRACARRHTAGQHYEFLRGPLRSGGNCGSARPSQSSSGVRRRHPDSSKLPARPVRSPLPWLGPLFEEQLLAPWAAKSRGEKVAQHQSCSQQASLHGCR